MACTERVIAGARGRLHPGGWLVLEHGFDQADDVRQLLARAGFEAVSTRHDLAGRPRVSIGRVGIAGT
jgi:release factor glutamine methyltransferase